MDFGVQCHCLQILGNEILDDNAVLPLSIFRPKTWSIFVWHQMATRFSTNEQCKI